MPVEFNRHMKAWKYFSVTSLELYRQNHIHGVKSSSFLTYSLGKKDVPNLKASSQEELLCVTDFPVDTSPNTTVLTTSCLEPVVIYLAYPFYLYFVLLSSNVHIARHVQ